MKTMVLQDKEEMLLIWETMSFKILKKCNSLKKMSQFESQLKNLRLYNRIKNNRYNKNRWHLKVPQLKVNKFKINLLIWLLM